MRLLAEAARSVVAQPMSSAITALIIGAVCVAILATTGQTIRAEEDVLSQIDAAGTRTILIVDTTGGAGFTADTVRRIDRVSGVEWVIGLSAATDVRSAGNPEGNPVPMRTLVGQLPPQIVTAGADLEVGRALIGNDALEVLGFQSSVGGAVGGDGGVAIVGSFAASDPLDYLNQGVVTRADNDDVEVRRIQILAETPAQVARLADAALSLSAPEDPGAIAVETSEAIAEIRAAVRGELGRFGRSLISLVLSSGLVLTGLNVFSSVSSRRRDFGRRRALGASRLIIVGIVATQTALAAGAGAAVGTFATLAITDLVADQAIHITFAAANAVLAALVAVVASLPPALIAAYRDPVSALRVA